MSPPQVIALRINDAAAAVGLSRSTLYKLIRQGKLRTIKLAGRRLIHMDALLDLLSKSHSELLP